MTDESDIIIVHALKARTTNTVKLLLATIALFLFAGPVLAQTTAVMLERRVAQAVWKVGTGESTETYEAVIAALRSSLDNPRSPAQARAANVKRCAQRDVYDSGPSDRCLRKVVILEFKYEVAWEWLNVLTDDSLVPEKLLPETGKTIERAFARLRL